jgi:RNA-directed DNA polymerase
MSKPQNGTSSLARPTGVTFVLPQRKHLTSCFSRFEENKLMQPRHVYGVTLVEVNEEKSQKADLDKGESFGFLGFEFRRIRSRHGRWMPLRTPKAKRRTALLGTLRIVFRRFQSQPVGRLIEEINPILRGWVNYSAMGHSSRCFAFIRNWVEQKIRSHLARACQRRGFGWKRWSREWLYGTLGLFNQYRVFYRPSPTAVPMP